MRTTFTVGTALAAVGSLATGWLATAWSQQPADALDPEVIEEAAETEVTVKPDGVVRIGWVRDEVPVTIDGMDFPPPAGLGSWAAFKPTSHGAMVMGDTVVFQDEVTPAMDAAFANGLEVTALHNHFFYDEPKVYFMHIGGHGDPQKLASGVRAVWDAIQQVRADRPRPAESFPGEAPDLQGDIDPQLVQNILGAEPSVNDGVVKVTFPGTGQMHGVRIGGSMGLATWAAFSGSNEYAAVDGDFIMAAGEVQPVMHALRKNGIHIVALHNHMIGEEPPFYFLHYWGKGSVEDLARGVKAALEAQKQARQGRTSN